ncbi:hypothetical protein BC829DRAFT_492193 [Chytridium lagenaria]|nr:hypothetical protein BC829DRAFT_492193 [Chytridium lagenaria]
MRVKRVNSTIKTPLNHPPLPTFTTTSKVNISQSLLHTQTNSQEMPSFSNVPMTTIVAAGAVKTISSKRTPATKPTTSTTASNQPTFNVQAAINSC